MALRTTIHRKGWGGRRCYNTSSVNVWTALRSFHPQQPCMGDPSRGVAYREEPPCPRFAGIVECFWELRASADAAPFTCLGVPDGCVDWVFGASSFRDASLTALLSSSRRVSIPPEAALFGLRFLPATLNLVCGHPLGDIYDKRNVLSEHVTPGIAELEARLFEAADFATKKALAEGWLAARLARSKYEPPPWLLACLDRIYHAHGNLSVRQLARAAGLGERQLLRLFRSELGLAPKAFTRVVRFQHALGRLTAHNGTPAVDIALDAGYYDQAHFIHELHALCGIAPSSLVIR